VEIRVGCGQSQVVMSVADDGTGFDPDESTQGMGLVNMAERVADCGGSFRVDTGPDGTVVRATFPLGEG
jgi:signal transduction histidine kinase